MPLNSEIGAADANSYVSLEAAAAYFEFHPLASAWAALSTEQKSTALVTATRKVDRLRFWGCKASDSQALQFPRVHCGVWEAGKLPKELFEAVCEEAMAIAPNLAAGGKSQLQKLQEAGIRQHTIGELTQVFDNSRVAAGAVGTPEHQLCEEARVLLRGFVNRGGKVTGGHRLS